jgi:hypothetical protein
LPKRWSLPGRWLAGPADVRGGRVSYDKERYVSLWTRRPRFVVNTARGVCDRSGLGCGGGVAGLEAVSLVEVSQ